MAATSSSPLELIGAPRLTGCDQRSLPAARATRVETQISSSKRLENELNRAHGRSPRRFELKNMTAPSALTRGLSSLSDVLTPSTADATGAEERWSGRERSRVESCPVDMVATGSPASREAGIDSVNARSKEAEQSLDRWTRSIRSVRSKCMEDPPSRTYQGSTCFGSCRLGTEAAGPRPDT